MHTNATHEQRPYILQRGNIQITFNRAILSGQKQCISLTGGCKDTRHVDTMYEINNEAGTMSHSFMSKCYFIWTKQTVETNTSEPVKKKTHLNQH